MEQKIKELIEKYKKEYNSMITPLGATPTWLVIRDLESLLELHKKNCIAIEDVMKLHT